MTDILFVLGSNIKKIRKEFGWTQQFLAEKSGISVPFMTQIELGRKSASLEVVQKIAAAMDVPYQKLFDEESAESDSKPVAKNLISLEKNISDSVMNLIHEKFAAFEEE